MSLILASGMGTAHAGSMSETQIGVELLQLERDSNQNIIYVWDNAGNVGIHADDTAVDTTGSFDDTADPGFRLNAARKLTDKWSIHGAYTTFGKLDKTSTFSDPSAQLDVFWTGGTQEFDSADIVQASYTSELKNFEVNAVYAMSDRLDVFAGVSQMTLDESFKVFSDDYGLTGTGQYNIDTSNDLLGVQLGINLSHPATDSLNLYVLAKLGWYNNSAEQKQTVTDPVYNRNASASGDGSSTVYEIRLGGSYDFGNNILMNLGYQYTTVTDVALAESQFDVVGGGAALSSDGEIAWQGLNLGLSYYF
jgi:opacity protein-like surface antigen